ncbi:hypothetical protein D3C83_219130 [compost metagenome]
MHANLPVAGGEQVDRRGQAVQRAVDLPCFVEHAQIFGERRLQFDELAFATRDAAERLGQFADIVAE